jgi:hypothetical protein
MKQVVPALLLTFGSAIGFYSKPLRSSIVLRIKRLKFNMSVSSLMKTTKDQHVKSTSFVCVEAASSP